MVKSKLSLILVTLGIVATFAFYDPTIVDASNNVTYASPSASAPRTIQYDKEQYIVAGSPNQIRAKYHTESYRGYLYTGYIKPERSIQVGMNTYRVKYRGTLTRLGK
jgi:hypothetical protein